MKWITTDSEGTIGGTSVPDTKKKPRRSRGQATRTSRAGEHTQEDLVLEITEKGEVEEEAEAEAEAEKAEAEDEQADEQQTPECRQKPQEWKEGMTR